MKRTTLLNVWVLKVFGNQACLDVGNWCLGKQLLLCLSRCVDTSFERNSERISNAVKALAACCFARSLKQATSVPQSPNGLL